MKIMLAAIAMLLALTTGLAAAPDQSRHWTIIQSLPCSAVAHASLLTGGGQGWGSGLNFGIAFKQWTKEDFTALGQRSTECRVSNREPVVVQTSGLDYLKHLSTMASDPEPAERRAAAVAQAAQEAAAAKAAHDKFEAEPAQVERRRAAALAQVEERRVTALAQIEKERREAEIAQKLAAAQAAADAQIAAAQVEARRVAALAQIEKEQREAETAQKVAAAQAAADAQIAAAQAAKAAYEYNLPSAKAEREAEAQARETVAQARRQAQAEAKSKYDQIELDAEKALTLTAPVKVDCADTDFLASVKRAIENAPDKTRQLTVLKLYDTRLTFKYQQDLNIYYAEKRASKRLEMRPSLDSSPQCSMTAITNGGQKQLSVRSFLVDDESFIEVQFN